MTSKEIQSLTPLVDIVPDEDISVESETLTDRLAATYLGTEVLGTVGSRYVAECHNFKVKPNDLGNLLVQLDSLERGIPDVSSSSASQLGATHPKITDSTKSNLANEYEDNN